MGCDDLNRFLVSPAATVRDVLALIDATSEGVALAVDEQQRLLATITDGDVRRAMLQGINLSDPVRSIIENRAAHPAERPLTIPANATDMEAVELMNQHGMRHLPKVAEDGKVVGLALLSQIARQYELPLRAVVLAGGQGRRLLPLTEDTPKPMLPIGERPLLEHTVKQLRECGIKQINLLTHYRGEVITEYFGNGEQFGVKIECVQEDKPLGTAGGLSLLDRAQEPLVVVNGDILTGVNFKSLYHYHCEQRADMTVGVCTYEMQIPFGVVDLDDGRVSGITEKPVVRKFVNAGVYLLSPAACAMLEPGAHCNMTELIERHIAAGKRVVPFPIGEYWIDIGSAADYARAQQIWGRRGTRADPAE